MRVVQSTASSAGTARKPRLHPRVVRPAAALRRHPIDILGRVLDIAGLAVQAVLRVDLEARRAPLLDHLVDRGRAITLRGLGIGWQIIAERNVRVRKLEVDRLILLVVGAREEDARTECRR